MRNSGRGNQNYTPNNGQKAEKRNLTLLRLNEERLAYAMSCLVGKDVVVNLNNGDLVRGSFHSFDANNKNTAKPSDIALKNAHIASVRHDEDNSPKLLMIAGSDYSYMVAKDIVMSPTLMRQTKSARDGDACANTSSDHTPITKRAPSSQFKTDAEIAASRAGRQDCELTEWKPDEPVDESQLYELEEGNRPTGWDQFESNRRAFGVKSTYNENLYTTELKLDKVPRQIKEQANKLAAEIMGSNGEHSYSHLETYLEQDEDTMNNPVAEAIVKKALSKTGKDVKKDEKNAEVSKNMARSAGSNATSGPQNQRQQSSGKNASQKEVMPSTGSQSSQPSKVASSGQKSKDSPTNASTSHASKREGRQKDQRHGDSTSASPFHATEEDRQTAAVDSHANASRADDLKKNERNMQLAPPQKNEDRNAQKQVTSDVKPITPPVAASLSTKKTFTFNPNASAFTPISAMNPSASAASASSAAQFSANKAGNKAPQGAGGKTSGTDANVTSVISAFENLEFRAFKTMNEYPMLEVSAYTNGNWRSNDQQYSEMWPNCSDASYRTIIGDISMFYPAHGMMAMRATHPMIPAPGMATFLMPPGTPVAYPAYSMTGIPINMMQYARQGTPMFYGAPRPKNVSAQAQSSNRRANPRGPIASQPQSPMLQQTGKSGNKS